MSSQRLSTCWQNGETCVANRDGQTITEALTAPQYDTSRTFNLPLWNGKINMVLAHWSTWTDPIQHFFLVELLAYSRGLFFGYIFNFWIPPCWVTSFNKRSILNGKVIFPLLALDLQQEMASMSGVDITLILYKENDENHFIIIRR